MFLALCIALPVILIGYAIVEHLLYPPDGTEGDGLFYVVVKDEDGKTVEVPDVREPFVHEHLATQVAFILRGFASLPAGWSVEVERR